jgi:hypothetical protein
LRNATDIIRVLVYKGEDASDVAWLLQGIRHISGIRPWQPAQRAKLVADQIEREGLGLKEAGQRFGLTAQAVGRLYRSYKALEQMRKDEEFSSEAKNEWFTLFEEAIRNPAVKTWLGWSEEEKRFTNLDHLHQFYAWIIPDTENSDRRRINDPRQIAKLGVLLEGQHQELLSQVDNHEVSVDAAADRIQQSQNRYDWREALEKAKQLIAGIPQSAIGDSPADVVASLDVLDEAIRKIRAMATAVQQSN